MDRSPARFEPIIISLIGAGTSKQSELPVRSPIAALLHRAGIEQRKLLVYVPGGVPGMPLCGPYDYAMLAVQLAAAGFSLVVPQMTTSQHPTPSPLKDCDGDIQSVLAWCADEGFDHVVMAGNGLGAARIVHWAGNACDPAVAALILLSPAESPYLAIERCGSRDQKGARDRILRSCESLLASDRGDEIVETDLDGARRAFTAEGFMDCFGPPDRAAATIVRFAGQIELPVCIIHGDRDPIAPPGGAVAVLDSFTDAARKEIVWIAGGDHHLLANPSTVEETGRAICTWIAAL